MRLRTLLGLALGLVAVACSSGPTPASSLHPRRFAATAPGQPPEKRVPLVSTSPVPWIAATPEPSPGPTLPPEVGSCRSSNLAASLKLQGATGALAGPLALTNRSSSPCTVSGRPHVRLIDSSGRALPVAQYSVRPAFNPEQPRPPNWPVVVLEPAHRALAFIVWRNWCHPAPEGARWRVTLAGGYSFSLPGPGSIGPRCDGPSAASTLGVAPLEPDLSSPKWPLVPMIEAPPAAVAGRSFIYQVTLFHPENEPFRFSRCPPYREELKLGGQTLVVEAHVLNCGPVGEISPDTGALFDMVLQVPTTTSFGKAQLTWTLDPGYGFSSSTEVMIVPT